MPNSNTLLCHHPQQHLCCMLGNIMRYLWSHWQSLHTHSFQLPVLTTPWWVAGRAYGPKKEGELTTDPKQQMSENHQAQPSGDSPVVTAQWWEGKHHLQTTQSPHNGSWQSTKLWQSTSETHLNGYHSLVKRIKPRSIGSWEGLPRLCGHPQEGTSSSTTCKTPITDQITVLLDHHVLQGLFVGLKTASFFF